MADLGKRINSAVNSAISNTQDDFATSVDVMLKGIVTALLESDVNIALVSKLRNNIRSQLLSENRNEKATTNAQTKKLIQKTVFDELCKLVTCEGSEEKAFVPKKRKTNIIMFVGLQGSVDYLMYQASGLLLEERFQSWFSVCGYFPCWCV